METSPATQCQTNVESNTALEFISSRFETIYEFVDTNPVPNDRLPPQSNNDNDSVTECDDGDDNSSMKLDERTDIPSDHVGKLKNFKCSICMKKFRKLMW